LGVQKERNKKIKLKPLGWVSSIVLFLVVAIILRVTHYLFVPVYTLATGRPYLVGYLIGWISTMFMFFAGSLIAYKLDGHPMEKQVFISRFRLGRMEKADWLWALAMLLFAVLSLAILSFTQPI
jgi:hypothetical protein